MGNYLIRWEILAGSGAVPARLRPRGHRLQGHASIIAPPRLMLIKTFPVLFQYHADAQKVSSILLREGGGVAVRRQRTDCEVPQRGVRSSHAVRLRACSLMSG